MTTANDKPVNRLVPKPTPPAPDVSHEAVNEHLRKTNSELAVRLEAALAAAQRFEDMVNVRNDDWTRAINELTEARIALRARDRQIAQMSEMLAPRQEPGKQTITLKPE